MSTGIHVPHPAFVAMDAAVTAKAASATLTIDDFRKNITNTGATAAITLTLPPANTVNGLYARIKIAAAYGVTVTPATGESIAWCGDDVPSKYLSIPGTIGYFVEIFSDGVKYHVIRTNAPLTKQA